MTIVPESAVQWLMIRGDMAGTVIRSGRPEMDRSDGGDLR